VDERLKQAANEIDKAVVFIEAMANQACDVDANVADVLQFIGPARARLAEAGESHKATFAREAFATRRGSHKQHKKRVGRS
jgi:hypothetical protein